MYQFNRPLLVNSIAKLSGPSKGLQHFNVVESLGYNFLSNIHMFHVLLLLYDVYLSNVVVGKESQENDSEAREKA